MKKNTSENNLREQLAISPVADLIYYSSIGSTNTAALELIRTHANVKDWTLVYAEEQTAGRGRFERRWSMQPGASLAFTLIFLPAEREKMMLQLISPLAALAVCAALEKTCGLTPQIKWPNDVLINRKKTSGILAEAFWQGERMNGIALGIGINVLRGSVPPAEATLFPPTCIEAEISGDAPEGSGAIPDRLEILRETLFALAGWRGRLGEADFFDAWTARLAFLEEPVRMEHADGSHTAGILKGLTDCGDLLLDVGGGKMRAFSVGDVRLRPDA